jgi:hypothetical protein
MFHSVPGVQRVKMERFASVNTKTCASPHLKLRAFRKGFETR